MSRTIVIVIIIIAIYNYNYNNYYIEMSTFVYFSQSAETGGGIY